MHVHIPARGLHLWQSAGGEAAMSEAAMSEAERIAEACREIIAREREDRSDIKDMNCYGGGYCDGMIAAARELLACLEEEAEAKPP